MLLLIKKKKNVHLFYVTHIPLVAHNGVVGVHRTSQHVLGIDWVIVSVSVFAWLLCDLARFLIQFLFLPSKEDGTSFSWHYLIL